MFYSKYSDYSYEQVVEESAVYKQISDKLIDKYGSVCDEAKLKGVLYEGGFDDFTINTGRTKSNPTLERNKRLSYAYFLANNPETFDKMQKENIILFHGTRIEALPSILKYGMKSFAKSNEEGIEVTTGEKSTRMGMGREFISFTDDIGVALGYSLMGGTNEQEQDNSFGIMIGMSADSLDELRTCTVFSDIPEIGIRDNISIEHIKMLVVPPSKIEFVKKMVGDLPIEVAPANLDDPFYNFTCCGMQQALEELERLKPSKAQEQVEYTKPDMEELAKGRKLSRIFGWLNKLKEKTMNRRTEEHDR